MPSAKITSRVLMITAAIRINAIPETSILLASSLLSSPFLLATSAERETFMAKNIERPMNLGCVVRPIAATALLPSPLTMYESTSPTKATKNDSTTAGQAIFIVSLKRLLFSSFILFSKCLMYWPEALGYGPLFFL